MNVAIIPARGGSTRIPLKNVVPFHGKPIIAYSIECAKRSGLFDRIYVSTDASDIAAIAAQHGAYVHHRPPELANNEVGTQAVMAKVLLDIYQKEKEPIIVAACIYATAPLMSALDLQRAHAILIDDDACTFVFSVGTEPLADAGQFYFGIADDFVSGKPLIHPSSRMLPIDSNRVCDINTVEDLMRADGMYRDLFKYRQPEGA